MKAVILAAGSSTRLYPVTENIPKCLLEVGGRTMLEHQLDALLAAGIREVVVVTGYLSHLIISKIEEIAPGYPFKFSLVHNERYAETNNLYSLWQAKGNIDGDAFWCMHADVLFHPDILRAADGFEDDICLIADREILDETMKVRSEGSRATAIGKHVSKDEATGTFLGLARFSPAGGSRMLAEVEAAVSEGETDHYFTRAIERLISVGYPVATISISGQPWIEVDFPDELDQARSEVLPKIVAAGGEDPSLHLGPR